MRQPYCNPSPGARHGAWGRGILRSVRSVLPLLALLVAGCGADGASGSDEPPVMQVETTGGGGEDEGSSSSSGDGALEDGFDVCLGAPRVPPGRFRGSLAGKASNGGGACGAGGPEVFFRIQVEGRSDLRVFARGDGFEPRVGVFGNDCANPFDEAGLLCTQGVPGWVSDVPPGTELYVAVGASASDLEASESGAYELEVETRRVLGRGEICVPEARGRCEAGTTCMVPEGGEGTAQCVPISGDRCSDPIRVDVRRGTMALSIEPDVVHGDAHAHACAGERTPERVYRLELPPGSAEASLRVEGERVLALAARGPTCLPEEETACARDDAGLAPAFELEGPLPSGLYLFVELPEDRSSEQTPAVVRLELDD